MTSRRSAGVSPSQAAISPRVRPQPMQNPVSGSTTHTLMQGVSMSAMCKSSITGISTRLKDVCQSRATPDVCCAPNGLVLQLENAVFDAETLQPRQIAHAEQCHAKRALWHYQTPDIVHFHAIDLNLAQRDFRSLDHAVRR